jgi:hypothetical protein
MRTKVVGADWERADSRREGDAVHGQFSPGSGDGNTSASFYGIGNEVAEPARSTHKVAPDTMKAVGRPCLQANDAAGASVIAVLCK